MPTPSRPDPPSRLDAQARANRIAAFRAELDALEHDGIVQLTPDERDRIARHHTALLGELQRRFDIDPDATTHQMSRGMQAAALLGAVALSAAVCSFFYRIWGGLSTPMQVLLVTAATLLAVIGVEIADRRERSGYVASIVALVAFACFVLQLFVYGAIFNMRPTPGAFLAWGAFGLALGYAYRLRLLFAAGLISFGVWIAATLVSLSGAWWMDASGRPELIAISGCVLLVFLPLHGRLRRRQWTVPPVDPVVRAIAFGGVLLGLFTLTLSGSGSFLPFSSRAVEHIYQVVYVPVAALLIGLALRRRWNETYMLASTLCMIFLLTRFVDWWWDWMPKYLFFLVLGLLALTLLFALRTLRRRWLAGTGAAA